MIKATVTTYRPSCQNGGAEYVEPFPGEAPVVGDTVAVWARNSYAYGPVVCEHFIDDDAYAHNGRLVSWSENGVTTWWSGYGTGTIVNVTDGVYTISLTE